MGTYDVKRLDVAIQYIRRMAEGRNPVTNRPAPENEVLTNANVNRCLKFVEEILADVKSAGGNVGIPAKMPRLRRWEISKAFPYEVLKGFRYTEDKQISHFLGQIGGLLPEGQEMPVKATMITNWLRENGYLEKRMMEDTGKQNSVPTDAGTALGLYMEKSGFPPNDYYRVFYNEQAQRFIVDNFEKILTESGAMSREAREKRRQSAQNTKIGNAFSPMPVDRARQNERRTSNDAVQEREAVSREGFASVNPPAPQKTDDKRLSPGDDPAFASLVANIPFQQGAEYENGGWKSGTGFMDDGWGSVDEGLPW